MTAPRVVAIIQARMTSSRLPGKVLADICGQPSLAWMAIRAKRAQLIDEVWVATTSNPADDAVTEFCADQGLSCTRGSEADVLDRYMQAVRESKADVIVRLTGDCPLIDPQMLDSNIHTFLDADPPLDFAANRLPGKRTIPIGLDAEICTSAVLERAWKEAVLPHQREHVMPYIYENADYFTILHIKHRPNLGHLRWTVDSPQDLELIRAICANFADDSFSWRDVLQLIEAQPELMAINADVDHRTQFDVDERT